MKDITRTKYEELRSIVRRNIWANSLEVTTKKYQYIYGFTVMGGIVLRKQIKPRRQSFLDSSRSGLTAEYGPPEYWLNHRRMEDMRPALEFRLEVFDFSGAFEIVMTLNHKTPQYEAFLRSVHKGDCVFARGQVMFSERTGNLKFEASWLGFEHELANIMKTQPEEFDVARLITDAVKKGGYYLKWDLCAGGTYPDRPEICEWKLEDLAMIDSEAAVWHFYRTGCHKEDLPGFLDALFGLYWQKKFRWIPRLIVKYFKMMVREGIGKSSAVRYGWRNDKERFLASYPSLRNKISWTGTKIDDLRLKKCDLN